MKRVVPGILLALCWFLLLYKGSALLFVSLMIPAAFWGADEYVKMAGAGRFSLPQRLLLDTILILPLLCTALRSDVAGGVVSGLLLAFAALTLFFFVFYANFSDSFDLFCRLVFGVVYLGVLGAHILGLRFLPEGGSWLIVLTAVTAGSDSGAYYVGRAFGKHKLCPAISPNKTREGAVGGLVVGVLAAMLFAAIFFATPNWWFLCSSAVLLTGAGIAGDLAESIIKRGTGFKDSGNCLGGHGGILDRIDSLLFAGPVLFYLVTWVR